MNNLNTVTKIEVGNLYIVEKPFWTSGEKTLNGKPSKVKYSKGDILEIRYPYAWHFRDESGHYDHVTESSLLKRASFFGKIHEDVRFKNKLNLKEILSQGRFHSLEDYQLTLIEDKESK